ncbi:MAG: aminotransferase [Dongiaceae bacterium]
MTVMRGNYDKARLRKLDADHHIHPFTNNRQNVDNGGALIFSRADGVYIWDIDNKRYLDGMSGLWCVNVGYGREELVEAASRQMRELPYYSSFFGSSTPATVELAGKVTSLLGGDLNHVFFANSGSEANDTIARIVRHYWGLVGKPEKQTIIARERAYHGSTMAAASMTKYGNMHDQGGLPLPGFVHIDPPYSFEYAKPGEDLDAFGLRMAKAIEDKILEIGADKVGAVIGEPVQGAGGVIIPPKTYWPAVEKICRKHDVLLIADEVICGFARTGEWFGFQTMGIKPDLVAMAKGLSSGYLPISAVAVSDRVAKPLIDEGWFMHGFTYSGHPVAAAVALRNIAIMEDEKLGEKVKKETGPYLAKALKRLNDLPIVGEVRSIGLLGAVELVADKKTRARIDPPMSAGEVARNFCMAHGAILRVSFETLVMSPPLIITTAQIDELVDSIHAGLKEAGEQLLG